MTIDLPSNQIRVLVCDIIDAEGVRKLREAGFEVDDNTKISKEQLMKVVHEYDVLIVRSRTKVTKEIIEAGKRLKLIGWAGSGVDNINVKSARLKRSLSIPCIVQ